MKRLLATVLAIALIALAMFAEYRFIMHNISPSVENNCIYLEVFGLVDEYEIN